MNKAPLTVQARPFAVEPITKIMLPDGIFDNAIYSLLISCHYSNTSDITLTNVKLYLEGASDPGIAVTPQTFTFATIPAGASVLVQWEANFQYASPGKPLVSFVANADGFSANRSFQQIFVSQTRYDATAKKWTCCVPEGRLEVTKILATKLADGWSKDGVEDLPPGPRAPTGLEMAWFPNPPFAGQFGDLPFSDPWWKILAFIVAVIAALVSEIASVIGLGGFSLGVKGALTDDNSTPSVSCCSLNTAAWNKNTASTVAAVAGVICSAAIAVACSDAADPIYRGEQNTVPQPNELTTSEKVVAHWTFVSPPNAGVAYKAKVKWRYQRITTGATYRYHVDEEQTNIHVVKNVEVITPATVPGTAPYLWAHAKFTKPDGTLYQGPELYTLCFFRSPEPDGIFFSAPLLDDGCGLDTAADDGTYTAFLNLKEARLLVGEEKLKGVWNVFVYGQEVNRTAPGTPPVVAAQTVGGNFIASSVHITFDPHLPCPFEAQGAIAVT